MARDQGYLLSEDHVKRLQRVVRDYETRSRSRPRWRRRQPVFPPGAGNLIYQAVSGLRLRPGTAAEPDQKELREPVVLAVQIGGVGDADLRNLRHFDVRKLGQLLAQSGAVTRGVVNQDKLDKAGNDNRILSVTREQLDRDIAPVALRTRFCTGYVGPGMTLVGNATEAWSAAGGELTEATIVEAVTGTDSLYIAQASFNSAAVSSGGASAVDLLSEYIAVRDLHGFNTQRLYNGAVVHVGFQQQVWFDNDDAYEIEHWVTDRTYGALPVFAAIDPPHEVMALCTSYAAADSVANFTILVPTGPNGDEAATGPTTTAYVRKGVVLVGKAYRLTHVSPGQSAGFDVADPDLTVRGKTASPVSAGGSGTFTIWDGALGAESSTGETVTAHNLSSCDVAAEMATIQYQGGGWQFTVGEAAS